MFRKNSESANLKLFFGGLNYLSNRKNTCEGLLTLEVCTKSLKQFMDNKMVLALMGLLLNFTVSSGVPLVQLWLIVLTMPLKMVKCQSHKNAVLYH